MGRSFYKPTASNRTENWTSQNSFYHEPSDTHYRMFEKGGAYFQRRFQIGFGGRETNVDEKRIDYVMGSGDHARTYLHRTVRGTLVELPVAWYAEQGGYWAMNPGYDHPHHPQARREIGYDCMFCHNAYPAIPEGRANQPVYLSRLPEGINCERCHGAGAAHIASHGQTGTILNPAKLSLDRQNEVCYQCHLDPTSFRLPHAVKRYGRGDFSYRPDEPLTNFLLYFDRAGPPDDRFEIASSAYRLRQSACFLKSSGKLACTTCHDPHGAPKDMDGACRSCHSGALTQMAAQGRHPATENCASCHMPKRRTEDVVHVVMTDHRIWRMPPGRDLTAAIPERLETDQNAYHGTVLPYYPDAPDELHRAAAQVRDGANLPPGIAQLTAAIAKLRPALADPYCDLAEALRAAERYAKAVPFYEEALRRDPLLLSASLGLGASWKALGDHNRALAAFSSAAGRVPNDARPWNQVGQTQLSRGAIPEALAAFAKALSLDPELPEAQNGFGVALIEQPDLLRSEAAFREAIRLQPDYDEAHANLATLLGIKQQFTEAIDEFETAIRLGPARAQTRFAYGSLLNGMRNFTGARGQLEVAVQLNAGAPDVHNLLGSVYEREGLLDRAGAEYAQSVRLNPEGAQAQLNLGAYLLKKGDRVQAREHLMRAADSADRNLSSAAKDLLRNSTEQQVAK